MNLLEGNNKDRKNWRTDIQNGVEEKLPDEDMEAGAEDLEYIENLEEEPDNAKEETGLLQKPYMTPLLIGVIILLLICIVVLLFFMPKNSEQKDSGASLEKLQQDIADYAKEQKENEISAAASGQAIVIPATEDVTDNAEEEPQEAAEETTSSIISNDADKTAIVVDVEDENDVSYTKEYILNEAYPYFADNNQEAIWDLAHLKRYVKLSAELKDSNSYYYQGDVNAQGQPEGTGLAIYEDNSYYYGGWSNGVRNGEGTWFHFYIGQKDDANQYGKYTAHSYSGKWANDLPNGDGAEHYDVDISKLKVRERILQNVIGNFTNALYDGDMYANTVDYTGNVEEWSGMTKNGVFTLWRDMSAIGECSVWQKTEDTSVYMDIDKSQNKNQGIRELLKIE